MLARQFLEVRMVCPLCGRAVETLDGVCPCSPRAYVLKAEPGRYEIAGQAVSLVAEASPEGLDGRHVDSRPASGGRSSSSRDPQGGFTAELSGPLARGRSNEAHALKLLVQALRARGEGVGLGPGARAA